MRFLVCVFLVSVCPAVFGAQVSEKQKTPETHLTPAEKQWYSVITSARAGAADMQPAMRSLTLDLIAGSLKKCSPSRVRKTLIDSFTSTLAIPETEEDVPQKVQTHDEQVIRAFMSNLEAKRRLQTAALTHLLPEDEAKVESLLPQAEPRVRSDLLNEMMSKAIAAKKLDRALSLLRQAPAEGFSYPTATTLMLELPTTRDVEKQEIFHLAMVADHERHSFAVGGDDFASMIVRFYKHLDPAIALEAIHQVLDSALSSHSQLSLGASSARASFGNECEFRVFELVPVLRELDADEADKILADSQAAQAQLKQFPNGIQSLNPAIRDTPPQKGESSFTSGMGGHDIGSMLRESNAGEAYDSRISEIARIAETNPKQAMETASGLPNSANDRPPRAQALLRIADVTMAKNPLAARDALEQMAESLKSFESARGMVLENDWAEGVEIATKIGEIDLAKKLLKLGMGQVEKLRSQDTDSDDPNLAPKAWWPSTAALSRLISAATSISPQTALDAIGEISDPELNLLDRVKLANKQLGVRVDRVIVVRNTRKSAWSLFGGPED